MIFALEPQNMVSACQRHWQEKMRAFTQEAISVSPEDSTPARSPAYRLTRSSIDILFWGGVLVVMGYPLHLGSFRELPIAPHASLGRVLLMIGGCMVYGCLAKSRLMPYALALMILCILQAVLMALGTGLYTLGGRARELDMVLRAKSLELSLDFAALTVLVVLVRAAGRSTRPGYLMGMFLYASLALLCLLAPLALKHGFWTRTLPDVLTAPRAQRPLMGVHVVLVMAALVALVKTHHLLRGHEIAPRPPREPTADTDRHDDTDRPR